MTVIAYKDGVIAADSLSTESGTVVCTTSVKVVRSRKGILGGASGPSTFCTAFRKWIEGECKKPITIPESGYGFIVRPNSNLIELHDSNGHVLYNKEYHAIGSGQDFALAVMSMGGSAVDAVEAAIKLNVYCGGPVRFLKR